MSKEEQRPFLDSDGDSETWRRSWFKYLRETNRLLVLSIVLNSLLLTTCVILSLTVFTLSRRDPAQGRIGSGISEPYSPAGDAIEYQYHSLIMNDTRFVGRPGPEWELSMHHLLEGTLIRISEKELKLSGSQSIPLKDGGYAAGLGVGHNLHCVKKIKMFLYREQFYPALEETDKTQFDDIQLHADHCLDFIRQNLMCYSDYSLYTLYWGDKRQDIPTHNYPPVQKCVNWDKLHSWMLDRSARSDMLVGPAI